MVDEVLEEVQLVPQSGQLPGTLSSGQRRRLALATAFVRPRKLLVMDEPEQRLDTEGVAWLAERLQVRAAVAGWPSSSPATSRPWSSRSPPGWSSWTPRSGERAGSSHGGRPLGPPMTAGLEPPVLTPASPRELKGLIKDWRQGRATRNLMEAFTDAYVVVIGALMVGAMVVNVVLRAQRNVAACDAVSCLSARALLPWAAFAAAVALALAASRLFGPVLASAAEGFWLLDAPISRARLLASRLVGALVIALVGGAVMGALVSALTGSAPAGGRRLGGATGLSAAAAVGVRRRPAGGGAAPADPRHDLRLRPARRWPPWWRWSGCRPAGSGSACPTNLGARAGRDRERVRARGAGGQCGAGPRRLEPDPARPADQRRRPGQRHLRARSSPSTSGWPATSWSSGGPSSAVTSRPRRGRGRRAGGAGLAGGAAAAAVPAAAAGADRDRRGAVRGRGPGHGRADLGVRGAGAVRGDHPAARRPAGADPDRRAGPVPALHACPGSSSPPSPCPPPWPWPGRSPSSRPSSR